jgi:hypothetical protein
VTQAGITYREYETRLLDTTVKVNRYVESPPDFRHLGTKLAIMKAMRAYQLAGSQWNAKIIHDTPTNVILGDPTFDGCPSLAGSVRKDREAVTPQTAVSLAWECASASVAEADKSATSNK